MSLHYQFAQMYVISFLTDSYWRIKLSRNQQNVHITLQRPSFFVNMKPYESYFLKYVRLPAAPYHLSSVHFRCFVIRHTAAEPPPSISLKNFIDRQCTKREQIHKKSNVCTCPISQESNFCGKLKLTHTMAIQQHIVVTNLNRVPFPQDMIYLQAD